MEKKIKIEIKNRWTGSIIFEYSKKDNTIKDTLEEAIRRGANLRYANLRRADLRRADLFDAYLRLADLRCADLGYANLRGANLRGANLRYADLRCADLCYADLGGAELRCADLGGAELFCANLVGANLFDADLRDADLGDANLRGADLGDANNIPLIPMSCPSDGAFIGWKKVDEYLVKLLIPEDARRCSETGRKCRCDKAKVLEITSIKDANESIDEVINNNYCETLYKVGEFVFPDSFDENRWNECSNGIHFFINKEEAIRYND